MVNEAWCGLKQAGKIAHDNLVEGLEQDGCQKTTVEGCFKHETCDITFTLVVDDFLIKHTNEEDFQHLSDATGKHCAFKVDTDAKQCAGIHLKWNCKLRMV